MKPNYFVALSLQGVWGEDFMKQLTLAGHPVHPQIVAIPIGLLSFSAAMDVMYVATGKQRFADAAYYSLAGGLIGGVAAAATGVADYLTISPGGPMKQMANTHALLNASVMTIEGANFSMRRQRSSGVGPMILSLVSAAGLVISQWYGAELVYKLGMRVREAKRELEARIPGDEAIERGLGRLAEYAPASGPVR